eukprot:61771_1
MAEAMNEPQDEKNNELTNHIWPISLIVNKAYAVAFACTKCNGVPKLCMTDEDGEILCNKCAENVDNTMVTKPVQKMVNKLKIKCCTLLQNENYNKQNNDEESEGVNLIATNQEQCDWMGQIQDYDIHSKECPFVIVECKECKTVKCKRKLLDKHVAECP